MKARRRASKENVMKVEFHVHNDDPIIINKTDRKNFMKRLFRRARKLEKKHGCKVRVFVHE